MNWAWNREVFLWLNEACAWLPAWWWSSLTILGGASVAFALLAPLLHPRLRWGSCVMTALFLTGILGGLVSKCLKELFQVARPPAVLPLDAFHLIGHKLELVSFPSGHSLTAFAVVAVLVWGLQAVGAPYVQGKRWRIFLWLIAAGVGLSRLAVGAHWPLDVMAGALLGVLCGYVGVRLAVQLHRQAFFQSPKYAAMQTLVLIVISLSALTETGYPQALWWQMAIGVWGTLLSGFFFWQRMTLLFPSRFNH